MTSNYAQNNSSPLKNVQNGDSLLTDNPDTFWQSILSKYEERNLELVKKQLELRSRLQNMQCPFPPVLLGGEIPKAGQNNPLLGNHEANLLTCNVCKTTPENESNFGNINNIPKVGNTCRCSCKDGHSAFNANTHLTLLGSSPCLLYQNPSGKTKEIDPRTEEVHKDLTFQNSLATEELKYAKLELLRQCMKRLEIAINQRFQVEQPRPHVPDNQLHFLPNNKTSQQHPYMHSMSNILNEITCVCNKQLCVKDTNAQLTRENADQTFNKSSIMGDNQKVGDTRSSEPAVESLDVIARQLSRTLLDMEKCRKCKHVVPEDMKHTAKCITCLLDTLHKISLKKQELPTTKAQLQAKAMVGYPTTDVTTPSSKNYNSIGTGTAVPITTEKGITVSRHLIAHRNVHVACNISGKLQNRTSQQADVSTQFNSKPTNPKHFNKKLQTSDPLQDELEITTSKGVVNDAESDLKIKLSLHDEVDTNMSITFRVDDSGTIREVVTEGPNGTITSTLNYTESETIDVVTEIVTFSKSNADKYIMCESSKSETSFFLSSGRIALLVTELSGENIISSSVLQTDNNQRERSTFESFPQKTVLASSMHYKTSNFSNLNLQFEEEISKSSESEVRSITTSMETLYKNSHQSRTSQLVSQDKGMPDKYDWNSLLEKAQFPSSESLTSSVAFTDALEIETAVEDNRANTTIGDITFVESTEKRSLTQLIKEEVTTSSDIVEMQSDTSDTTTEKEEAAPEKLKSLILKTAVESELTAEEEHKVEILDADTTSTEEIPTPQTILTDHFSEDETAATCSLVKSLSEKGLTPEEIITEAVLGAKMSIEEETLKINPGEVITREVPVLRRRSDEEVTGKSSLPKVTVSLPPPTDYWNTVCKEIKDANRSKKKLKILPRPISCADINGAEYWSGIFTIKRKSIFSAQQARFKSAGSSASKVFEAAKFSSKSKSSVEEVSLVVSKNNLENQNDTRSIADLNKENVGDTVQSGTAHEEQKEPTTDAEEDSQSSSSNNLPSVIHHIAVPKTKPQLTTAPENDSHIAKYKTESDLDDVPPCTSSSVLQSDGPSTDIDAGSEINMVIQENETKPATENFKIDIDLSQLTNLTDKFANKKVLNDGSLTEERFRKGVLGALQKANKDVVSAVEQANKYISSALSKVNRDVNSALALARKEKNETIRRRKISKCPSSLELSPEEDFNDQQILYCSSSTAKRESTSELNRGAGEELLVNQQGDSCSNSSKPRTPRTSLTLSTAAVRKYVSENLSLGLNQASCQNSSKQAQQKPNYERRKNKSELDKPKVYRRPSTLTSTSTKSEMSRGAESLSDPSGAARELTNFLSAGFRIRILPTDSPDLIKPVSQKPFGAVKKVLPQKAKEEKQQIKKIEKNEGQSTKERSYPKEPKSDSKETPGHIRRNRPSLMPRSTKFTKSASSLKTQKSEISSFNKEQPKTWPKIEFKTPIPKLSKVQNGGIKREYSVAAQNENKKKPNKNRTILYTEASSTKEADALHFDTGSINSPFKENTGPFSKSRSRKNDKNLPKAPAVVSKSSSVKTNCQSQNKEISSERKLPKIRYPRIRSAQMPLKEVNSTGKAKQKPSSKPHMQSSFSEEVLDYFESVDDKSKKCMTNQVVQDELTRLREKRQRSFNLKPNQMSTQDQNLTKRKFYGISEHQEECNCLVCKCGKCISKTEQRKIEATQNATSEEVHKKKEKYRGGRKRLDSGKKLRKQRDKSKMSLDRAELQKQLSIMLERENASVQESFSCRNVISKSETTLNDTVAFSKQSVCDILDRADVLNKQINDMKTEGLNMKQSCPFNAEVPLDHDCLSEEENAFKNSLVKLQTALSSLRNKCKQKDQLISTITLQVKNQEQPASADYKLVMPKSPPSLLNKHTTKSSMQHLSETSKVPEICMPFPPQPYRQCIPRQPIEPWQSFPPNKQTFVSKNSPHTLEIATDFPLLKITEVRRIASDSIIVKWAPRSEKTMTGYEISVDGLLKSRIRNCNMTSAILHNLMLESTLCISIYALNENGRYLPPATARYKV